MSQIENVLQEHRKFPPPAAFQRDARLNSEETYQRMYAESLADPEAFWGRVAKELPWIKPWTRVLDWSQKPFAKWFVGGQLNASAVCLDQHVESLRGGRRAILWEGEPGDTRSLTYTELSVEVCRFANALKQLGVKKGDRVALYLPMIPEAVIAMLACARIGAAHSVVFAGFATNALRDRILDGGCTAVITADGSFRRGQLLDLKVQVDEALKECPDVRTVVVVRRAENEVAWHKGRDVWFHEAVSGCSDVCPPEPMDSEDLLYLLYTSGSTGKPKGIVHTTGGYMVGAYLSTQFVFDLREEDVFWCTADIGWVTGHTYVVYGPLANCATIVMYEGAPNTPHQGRFWEIVQKYKVSVFYTAPTAIRTFMRWGEQIPRKYDLSTLRLLGTVGEPINPEAWMWYREVIGGSRCPIVDTWWQTETGSILMTPLPGLTSTKPGSATRPFFGVEPAIVDEQGAELGTNQGGFLVLKQPWPSMLRGIWGDPERYVETYWKRFDGRWYVTGDGARCDEDGYYWLLGRVDDVIKVSGHRFSTMEVESALVAHASVVEAAVVGRPDELTGQAICAFVTLGPGQKASNTLKVQLTEHVTKEIGKVARPAEIRFTEALPKTRSGKIMRRLLRDIAAGVETVQDTTTLEDYQVLARLRNYEE